MPIMLLCRMAGASRIASAELIEVSNVMRPRLHEACLEGVVEQELQHRQSTTQRRPELDQDRLPAPAQDDLVEREIGFPEGVAIVRRGLADRLGRRRERGEIVVSQ